MSRLLRRSALVVIAVVWTLPITGLVVNALRSPVAGSTSGWWNVVSDPQPSIESLRSVLSGSTATPSLFDALLSSLAVAVPSTVLVVGLGTLAAYALAWTDVPGRRTLIGAAVVLVVVPVQVALIPLVAAYDATGLRGGVVGLWLAHAAFGLPLAVLLLWAAMREVPADLVDAARSDGAGHFAVLGRIVAPLVVPALVGVATLQFLLVWNDLVVTVALLGDAHGGVVPLPLALAALVSAHPQADTLLAAGAVVTLVVPLAIYAALSRVVVGATEAVTLGQGETR